MRFWQVLFFFFSNNSTVILIYCHTFLFFVEIPFFLSHHKLFDSLSWSLSLSFGWSTADSIVMRFQKILSTDYFMNKMYIIYFFIFHSFCSPKKVNIPELATQQRCRPRMKQKYCKHNQIVMSVLLVLLCNICICQKHSLTHTETVFSQLANNNQQQQKPH